MNGIPETRMSLILRLPGGADTEAWREFVETYEPFIYRFACRHGLQDSDARELVQDVFLGITKAIRRWQPDATQAKFRTWLFRIAKNQLLTQMRRRRNESPVQSSVWNNLTITNGRSVANDPIEAEYRREVFIWASHRVRDKVQPVTWSAFWQSAVEGRSPEAIATDLGISRAAVYVARSRVISRLRAQVALFENHDE